VGHQALHLARDAGEEDHLAAAARAIQFNRTYRAPRCPTADKILFLGGRGSGDRFEAVAIPTRYSQAHALQAVFVDALRQVKEHGWFSNSEAYMRMALKAQSNCRATIETLAAIKNPSVVFARQANIAQGPQQVNNAMMPAPRAGAGKTEKRQNELSGGSNELLPDLRTPGAAIGSDPAMAAVAAFDRAKVRRR
jgi:hypothetical protein